MAGAAIVCVGMPAISATVTGVRRSQSGLVSPVVIRIGRGTSASAGTSSVAQPGSSRRSMNVWALPIAARRSGSGSRSQAPGPSTASSKKRRVPPATSPSASWSWMLASSASTAGSRTTPSSGGSWARTLRTSSGRRMASAREITAP